MPSFVKNTAELANSVHAFMQAPEYWRDAIGNHPKYFVHVKGDNEALFGLAKFCAFRNISLEDYIVGAPYYRWWQDAKAYQANMNTY